MSAVNSVIVRMGRLALHVLGKQRVQEIFGQPLISEQRFRQIDQFKDRHGETFPILEGFRDAIKPGWQSMLDPRSARRLPDKRQIVTRQRLASRSVTRMFRVLSSFEFDVAGKRVLEIGCYDGVRCHAIADSGAAHVTGSDITTYYIYQDPQERMTEQARVRQDAWLRQLRERMHPMVSSQQIVTFVEDSITNSRLEDASFDLICSWDVLEHIPDSRSMFHEMWRLLKPGGFMFHEYNPFFSLTGGHSLCTLDFPWGHVLLEATDFKTYLETFRPEEAEVAWSFYTNNLNRMSLNDFRRLSDQAGFECLLLTPFSNPDHVACLTRTVLSRMVSCSPGVTITDLVSPVVWSVLQKPRQSVAPMERTN